MRYLALACDYDGTLATRGRVAPAVIRALERFRASGRRLILVTGRELEDLLRIFPRVDLFERVVAENGALLYNPADREEKVLADPPPPAFLEALRAAGVSPLEMGRVIVATRVPHEVSVLRTIRDLGLELQVIFNKGAVMVLPAGCNKATGLEAALAEMGLSPRNVVAVGDAENDHAFLRVSECSVAVADALPMLKESADLVSREPDGAGVTELVEEILANDLRDREERLSRHHVLLGAREDGREVKVSPYGINLLLTGTSGSGKSTLATGFLERLAEKGYQFCVVDPEGDHETMEGVVVLGDPHRQPGQGEVLRLLESPRNQVAVNLLGFPLQDRPAFFSALLPRLTELRLRTGRPHWIVVDEAHHLLPSPWDPATLALSQELKGMMFITVHPDELAPAVLSSVDMVVVVGDSPASALEAFAGVLGEPPPPVGPLTLKPGEALAWSRRTGEPPLRLKIEPPRTARLRHRRKYAEGQLGEDKSFYFRGPEKKLNLRAQNLILFLQLARGVDDETWLHHLRRGDYSRWFREAIKDETLAQEAERVEKSAGLSAGESRSRIAAAIERLYTLPEAPAAAQPGARGA